jgi:inosose dehydratase
MHDNRIRIANAPCSWGVLEFELAGRQPDYTQVLDEMREAGFAGTELGDWGFMPVEPDRLKEALQARDLTLLGAFVPVAFGHAEAHADGETLALRTAQLMCDAGFEQAFIILSDNNGSEAVRTQNAGRVLSEHGLSEAGWQVFSQGVQRIARAVRSQWGMRTVYHHHCAGFVETPQELDTLMRLTEARLVGLCLDTGHCTFGGGDPLQVLQTHRDRVWHLHFKDCDMEVAAAARSSGWDYFEAVRHGIFCELGQGVVDFPAFLEQLTKMNYQGWIVVEQDVFPGMGTPKVCADRNRKYLKGLGL